MASLFTVYLPTEAYVLVHAGFCVESCWSFTDPRWDTIQTKHGNEFDKTEVTANIHKYCPSIINKANAIFKHPDIIKSKTDID